ncbi:hypothetical protein HY489_02320 [Candidatus Woesearchaeota archaeon]|nr:hypothetical protein [Candidatus Woesearchaeota archaeon]
MDREEFLSRVKGGVVVFDAQVDIAFLSQLAKVAEGIALVGCRSGSLNIVRDIGIQLYSMQSVLEDLPSLCDGVMELARSWTSFHALVSAHALDPAFEQHEFHGGLQSRELFYCLERLRLLRNFAGGATVDFQDGVLEGQVKMRLAKAL